MKRELKEDFINLKGGLHEGLQNLKVTLCGPYRGTSSWAQKGEGEVEAMPPCRGLFYRAELETKKHCYWSFFNYLNCPSLIVSINPPNNNSLEPASQITFRMKMLCDE